MVIQHLQNLQNLHDLSILARQASWDWFLRAYEGGHAAPDSCKDVVWEIVYSSTFLKVSFYREWNKQDQWKHKEQTRLAWAKPRAAHK